MPLQPVSHLILNFPLDERDWEGGGRQCVTNYYLLNAYFAHGAVVPLNWPGEHLPGLLSNRRKRGRHGICTGSILDSY